MSAALPALPAPLAACIAGWPAPARAAFRDIRAVIHAAARDVPAVGPLTETLKWGEPAWLTEASGSGTTLRVAWKPREPDLIGLYVNCRTGLLETIRHVHPGAFRFRGTRGLMLPLAAPLPHAAIDMVARAAQSYHRRTA